MHHVLRRLDEALIRSAAISSGGRAGWRETAIIAALIGAVATAATISEYYLHRRLVAAVLWLMAFYFVRASLRPKRSADLQPSAPAHSKPAAGARSGSGSSQVTGGGRNEST